MCAKRPRRKIWTSASEVESKPREAYPLSEKKGGNPIAFEGEAQAVDSEEELQLSPTLCSLHIDLPPLHFDVIPFFFFSH